MCSLVTNTSPGAYVRPENLRLVNKNPEICMICQVDGADDEFVKYSLGNVGEAYANDDLNDVAIRFIAFSVGLNCEVALSTDTLPNYVHPKLKLRLGPSCILAAALLITKMFTDLTVEKGMRMRHRIHRI